MNNDFRKCEKCGHLWNPELASGKYQCPNCGDPHFLSMPKRVQSPQKIDWCFWRVKHESQGKEYRPNLIPLGDRIFQIASAILLFSYGTYGVYIDDILTPGKKRAPGIHLHGTAAWICYFSIVIACCVILSVVLDHYDRRNNEHNYKVFARYGTILGWTVYALSLFWQRAYGA